MINHFKLKQIQLGFMKNYVYFLQNIPLREVFVVDPAWDVPYLQNYIEENRLKLKGILITHGHPDHTNGIEGLLKIYDIPVYVSQKEAFFYSHISENIVSVSHGDKLSLGALDVECLHTPGHSPGSQCFRVENSLISGDTLFLDGCGRCDLPGGNVEELYHSLKHVILSLPDSMVLYPGHNYHPLKKDTLKKQKKTNPYLRSENLKDFIAQRLPL